MRHIEVFKTMDRWGKVSSYVFCPMRKLLSINQPGHACQARLDAHPWLQFGGLEAGGRHALLQVALLRVHPRASPRAQDVWPELGSLLWAWASLHSGIGSDPDPGLLTPGRHSALALARILTQGSRCIRRASPNWPQSGSRGQGALVVKSLPVKARDIKDMGSIPGWGRSPGGGHGHPPKCSRLEDPMDRGA